MLQEIPENGADVAHLGQVHGPVMTAGVDLRYTYNKLWSFAKHDWNGKWNQDPEPDRKHIGVLELLHTLKVFGWRMPVLDLKVTAKQVKRIFFVCLHASLLKAGYKSTAHIKFVLRIFT